MATIDIFTEKENLTPTIIGCGHHVEALNTPVTFLHGWNRDGESKEQKIWFQIYGKVSGHVLMTLDEAIVFAAKFNSVVTNALECEHESVV